MGYRWPLFINFHLYKQTLQFSQQICVKNVLSIHILRRDSNPRPLECECPPITARPGLPPIILNLTRHLRPFRVLRNLPELDSETGNSVSLSFKDLCEYIEPAKEIKSIITCSSPISLRGSKRPSREQPE